MGQLLFVEELDGAVVVDAVVGGPVTARATLPGGEPLRSLVRDRLADWVATSTPVSWEVLHRSGWRLRLGDGTTSVTLDLLAA